MGDTAFGRYPIAQAAFSILDYELLVLLASLIEGGFKIFYGHQVRGFFAVPLGYQVRLDPQLASVTSRYRDIHVHPRSLWVV